jgi:hypothetical protein
MVRFDIKNFDTDEIVASFDVEFDGTRPWQLNSSIGSAFHQVSPDTPAVILNIPIGPEGTIAAVTPAARKKADEAAASGEEEAPAEEAEAKSSKK